MKMNDMHIHIDNLPEDIEIQEKPLYSLSDMAEMISAILERNDPEEIKLLAEDLHMDPEELKKSVAEMKKPEKTTDTPLRERLDQIEAVPADGKAYYHTLIDPILADGVTAEDLRDAAADKLMEVQDKIMQRNMMDILAGKYKNVEDMETMPLIRKENPDGSAQLLNVPEDYLFWSMFIGTLNEDYCHE